MTDFSQKLVFDTEIELYKNKVLFFAYLNFCGIYTFTVLFLGFLIHIGSRRKFHYPVALIIGDTQVPIL